MNPRIIVTAGPRKGAIFELAGGDASVGREEGNSVSLNDPSVSRRHCVIERSEDGFSLADLGSFNGTFVNGIPVKKQGLAHGDQIAVGDSLLLFLLDEDGGAADLGRVQLDGGDLVTRSTVRLRGDDALYLRPERVLSALPADSRVARDLNALLEVSTSLNSIRDSETLGRSLLESVLKAVPAERAAILLVRDGLDDVITLRGMDRKSDSAPEILVSRTVASQVLTEGTALFSNDIAASGEYDGAQSLLAGRTRALACAPLFMSGLASGVIYIDTSDPAASFDEGHLQFLLAVAGIASVAFENVMQVEWLVGENRRLREEISLEHDMVGESEPMRAVYRLLARAAASDSTVLIRGESGTGKELAARALHRNSPRADRPFVAVNCAALAESLLESELFGHERGAFTGAHQQKKGRLELADGGTVFLDEVGEMSEMMQAKLLRVLQEREFERVGGTRSLRVDVRIVAATNKDLKAAMSAGGFRNDLYYRLNVIPIEMPPLRERRDDVQLLATYFVARLGRKCGRRIRGISPEARECLMAYDWPGNVRELENVMERAVVLGAADFVTPEDLPGELLESVKPAGGAAIRFYEAVKEAKKRIIMNAVEQAGGNYSEAARRLGIHPNNLHRMITNLGMRDDEGH